MSANTGATEITLQVGSELRIKTSGEIVIDNPELELTHAPAAADAVISYRRDPDNGDIVLRLLKPVSHQTAAQGHR